MIVANVDKTADAVEKLGNLARYLAASANSGLSAPTKTKTASKEAAIDYHFTASIIHTN